MTYRESEIREIVRRALLSALGESSEASPPAARPAAGELKESAKPAPTATPTKQRTRQGGVIGEAEVLAAAAGGEMHIGQGAVVTPLARQLALERGVRFVTTEAGPVGREVPGAIVQAAGGAVGRRTVALGADHGGFDLKEQLKAFLVGEGYATVDCGTSSKESVDYPDFAYAVAKLVSDGKAWRGIIVDGAGIGSCMAANKVPGVRAAMCYDVSTSQNAREHNDANVLTLGGGLIGSNLANQIVKMFLTTEFGGGRHARRVDKIMDIERRFLK